MLARDTCCDFRCNIAGLLPRGSASRNPAADDGINTKSIAEIGAEFYAA
jgi:hypothetical protein